MEMGLTGRNVNMYELSYNKIVAKGKASVHSKHIFLRDLEGRLAVPMPIGRFFDRFRPTGT